MITYEAHPAPEVGGVFAPVVVCDACGKNITRSGNAYWVELPDGSVLPQVWHTHKFPCSRLDDALTSQFGGLVMSEELDVWLKQLSANFAGEATIRQE